MIVRTPSENLPRCYSRIIQGRRKGTLAVTATKGSFHRAIQDTSRVEALRKSGSHRPVIATPTSPRQDQFLLWKLLVIPRSPFNDKTESRPVLEHAGATEDEVDNLAAAFTARYAGLLQSLPRVHLEPRDTSGKVPSLCDLPMRANYGQPPERVHLSGWRSQSSPRSFPRNGEY